LRFVLSNQRRQVTLNVDDRRYLLSSERFLPKEDERIKLQDQKFTFENHSLNLEMIAFKKTESAEIDETQILIIDENNVVYDNTDVDIGIFAGFKDIRVIVRINGLYKVLRHYLNSKTPKELLRDSRDGFDKRNDFTKKLFKIIRDFTIQVLNELAELKKSEAISLKENKVFRSLIQEINKIYRELELRELGFFEKGSAPPKTAIEFVRSEASITHQKQYNLKLLVNSNLVNREESIELNASSDEISFTPKKMSISKDEPNELGLIVKNVVIKGNQITDAAVTLTASHENDETSINIKIVEEEIYYPEFIEIRPSKAEMRLGATKNFKLFINTEKFPFYSYVYFKIKDIFNKELSSQKIQFNDENLVSSSIAMLNYEFTAPEKETTLYLIAICDDYSTQIKIEVGETNKDDASDGLDGKFKDIELIESKRELWQTEYRPDTGKIFINKNNPINKEFLTPIENIVNQDTLSERQKLYLFDLVCIESARMIHLNQELDFENETFEKRLNKVLEMKTSIFKKLMNQ